MFAKPSSAFVGKPSVVASSSGQRVVGAVGERVAVDQEQARGARGAVVEVELGGLGGHPSIVSEERRPQESLADLRVQRDTAAMSARASGTVELVLERDRAVPGEVICGQRVAGARRCGRSISCASSRRRRPRSSSPPRASRRAATARSRWSCRTTRRRASRAAPARSTWRVRARGERVPAARRRAPDAGDRMPVLSEAERHALAMRLVGDYEARRFHVELSTAELGGGGTIAGRVHRDRELAAGPIVVRARCIEAWREAPPRVPIVPGTTARCDARAGTSARCGRRSSCWTASPRRTGRPSSSRCRPTCRRRWRRARSPGATRSRLGARCACGPTSARIAVPLGFRAMLLEPGLPVPLRLA